MEHRAQRRVGVARAQARGRSAIRSFHGRTIPPWDPIYALAAGQAAEVLHDGSGRASRRAAGTAAQIATPLAQIGGVIFYRQERQERQERNAKVCFLGALGVLGGSMNCSRCRGSNFGSTM